MREIIKYWLIPAIVATFVMIVLNYLKTMIENEYILSEFLIGWIACCSYFDTQKFLEEPL